MRRYWENRYVFNTDGGGAGGAGGAGTGSGGTGGAGGAAGSGAGGATPPWYEGKFDERTLGHVKNHWPQALNDPAALAIETVKSQFAAQQLLSLSPDQLLRIPTKADDEAGWNAVYTRLGKPAKADDYVMKNPDGTDMDPALATALRAAAFKAHVPKDAAATLAAEVAKFETSRQTEAQAAYDAKIAAEKTALATNWGAHAATNMELAKAGAKALGMDPTTVDALEKTIGYAKLMEMLRGVGSKTSEGQFHLAPRGNGTAPGGPMSVDQAKARKAELFADKEWAKKTLNGDAAGNRELLALDTIIANAMSHAA